MVQCKRNHFFAAAWLRLEGASRRSAMSLHLERIEVRTRFRSAAGKSSMTRRFIDHAIWASSIGASSTVVDLHNGLIGGPVDGRPFAEAKAPQTTMSMTERPLRVAASSFGLGTVSRMVRFDRPVDRWRTLPR